MSKMMIYAALSAVGGNIENVWGHKMRVKTIDPTDKEAVEQAKADGWQNNPQAIIEQMEVKQLQAENTVIKGELADLDAQERIAELEAENEKLNQELSVKNIDVQDRDRDLEYKENTIKQLEDEVKELKQKLSVYENAKDADGDGQVSYDEMTSAEIQELLKQRGVEFKARDNKDTLIQLAKDSE